MTARYSFGWSDARGVFGFNSWGRLQPPLVVLYDTDFAKTVEHITMVSNAEQMNIDAAISLWTVRFGEVARFEDVSRANAEEFLYIIGRRLHKLGYLQVNHLTDCYELVETPHNLGNTHHGDN